MSRLIYWHMRKMPSPFIGTRCSKSENFLVAICKRLGAGTTVTETNSSKKGYDDLKAILKTGDAAICYGDMAYLPYFALPEIAHFGDMSSSCFDLMRRATKSMSLIAHLNLLKYLLKICRKPEVRGFYFPSET